jgi:hypothetical protein
MRRNAGIRGVIQLDATLRAEAVRPDHPAHGFIRRRDEEIIGSLHAEIERELAAGRILSSLDTAVLARQIAALIEGVQLAWLYDDSVDMAAHLEGFLQLVKVQGQVGLRHAGAGRATATGLGRHRSPEPSGPAGARSRGSLQPDPACLPQGPTAAAARR